MTRLKTVREYLDLFKENSFIEIDIQCAPDKVLWWEPGEFLGVYSIVTLSHSSLIDEEVVSTKIMTDITNSENFNCLIKLKRSRDEIEGVCSYRDYL